MDPRIEQAVRILRTGGLVAFATETVYGLGADATNASAVQKIFAAKGRPSTNPLIVHVADVNIARRYTTRWDDTAQRLAERFWPGPLALILPKGTSIVPEVSAKRETVALRCPDHPLALELLAAFDGPVAAPSANRSTRVSPTTAQHVREELGNAVDMILDGGPCRVGIESTVVDLTLPVPTVLRPGAITAEELSEVIGPVERFTGSVSPTVAAASPGQHDIHYAPRAVAYRFTREQAPLIAHRCLSMKDELSAVLCLGPENATVVQIKKGCACGFAMLADIEHPDLYARELYATLRRLDATEPMVIFVEMPPDRPEWAAVRDRLMRATRPFSELLGRAR